MVVGDSFLIISQDRHQREIMNQIIGILHKRISGLLPQNLNIQLFHARHGNNVTIDKLENQASKGKKISRE